MNLNPLSFFKNSKWGSASTVTPTKTPEVQPTVATPLEQFTPTATPPAAPKTPVQAEIPLPPPVEAKPEVQNEKSLPLEPKPLVKEAWMDQDWNLGPAADSKSKAQDIVWKFLDADSSLKHPKTVLFDEGSDHFFGNIQSKPTPASGELDPLMAGFADLASLGGGGGITNFNQMAMDQQQALQEVHKALEGQTSLAGHDIGHAKPKSMGWPEGGITHSKMWVASETELFGVHEAQQVQATIPVVEAKPVVATCAGMTRAEVIAGVDKSLAALGKDNVPYSVDEKLFPSMERLNLNPVEFFTARACWQGVSTKRRAVLEKVLDQFPELPKDQKNWEGAVAAAQSKGTEITKTDKVFIQYFLENRKAMKSLFRATLPSGFQGNTALCYRGQSNDSQYGPNSTKPLGCYSIDPGISESWASGGNLKQFKVKLSDVWSTYTASQNHNRSERELTVYSRGGVRKGEKVQNIAAAKTEFNALYANDKLAKSLEKGQYKGLP